MSGQVIYKYELQVTDEQVLFVPPEAEVLALQVQHGHPVVWMLHDRVYTGDSTERRWYLTFGTGHPVDLAEGASHIGTYQMDGGALVFHVFEVRDVG